MTAPAWINATHISVAPGRVNLLGEHVDYNAGVVLPVAIDRSVKIAARKRSDNLVILQAPDLAKTVAFDLRNLVDQVDIEGRPLPTWALYPAGVAWVCQEDGLPVSGIEATYSGDIPIGAGLSSSAAVEVAFAMLWQDLGGWEASRMHLARLCQKAEHLFAGVNSGLMDQFASTHGVEGHALAFDTRSLAYRAIPLPSGTCIVIADSRLRRSLANSAYNERRAACEQAVALLQKEIPGIRSLRDVSPAQFAAQAGTLPPVVALRARHVVEEIARVEEALVCLEKGDADGFGRLMLAGHASLRDFYEVSCPELDLLVETAKYLPGCWGARLTGAGFGGCTVNLVEESQAGDFARLLKEEYDRLTGRQAEVFICRASRSAHVEHVG